MAKFGEIAVSTPDFTPSQKAKFALQALEHKPEFKGDWVVPGPTPPAMLAENERKAAAKQKRRVEIIAEHGVIDEYLAPLQERKKELEASLVDVDGQIAALEAARTPS